MTRFHCITDEEVAKIKAVRNRLYLEDHLNGDQMRDLAQTLDSVVNATIPYEEPKP